jgi:hypothetical protein
MEGGSHASASPNLASRKRRKQASRLGTLLHQTAVALAAAASLMVAIGTHQTRLGRAPLSPPRPHVWQSAQPQARERMANSQTPMPCHSKGCSDARWKHAMAEHWAEVQGEQAVPFEITVGPEERNPPKALKLK